MKKYFCKYLPVEGEIKEGDMVSDGVVVVENLPRRHKRLTKAQKQGKDSLKKVKLFLCSREVMIGDKVRANDRIDHEYVLTAKHLDKMEEFELEHLLFKVIGEISPDATWVKEGDEFDEDDIEQVSELYGWNKEYNTDKDFQKFFDKSLSKTCTHFIYEGETDWLDEAGTINLNFRVYTKIYKVKGPCGHFH